MEKNLTSKFIDSIYELSCKPLPDSVVMEMKYCLADYIACAELGASYRSPQHKRSLSFFPDESGMASVLGTGVRAPAATAALLNGISAHELELDDGHRYGAMHVGSVIFSGMLALAQSAKLSAEDFAKGVVFGYEAAIRLASAAQPGHKLRGYHTTATCGAMGCAVGMAIAMRASESQLFATLAASISEAAGLLELQEDGSELKPYNAGRAASAAINAMRIGMTGVKAPKDPLGGRRGFFAVEADGVIEDYLVRGFDPHYAIELIYRKPYAACRHTHAAIEGVLRLVGENGLQASDIDKILVETYSLAIKGHDHKVAEDSSSAKMSMPYALASAICFGQVSNAQFAPECIADEQVRQLMQRVEIKENPELSALVPNKRAAIVHLVTKTATYTARVDYPRGEPENPMTAGELKDKFDSLMKEAGCGKDTIEQQWNRIMKLEDQYIEFLNNI